MIAFTDKTIVKTISYSSERSKYIPKNLQIEYKSYVAPHMLLQCWFKLSGQNEQNLNFETRFSQIGLRLDKKWREQKIA